MSMSSCDAGSSSPGVPPDIKPPVNPSTSVPQGKTTIHQEPQVARKAFVVTDAVREKVRYLAGLGGRQDDIAKFIGCAPKTLHKRFRGELDRGVAEANALPAAHDDIDISGIELEAVADPAGHFGGDQTGARAEKRVIDRLAGPAVVGDRAAHAFDRLLGAVSPALLALPVVKRIVVGDLPDRGLRAVALPMAGLALAHGVPTGFVLPVVIATAQREVLLDTDDLRAQLQPASGEAGGDDIAVQGAEPDIGGISGEQRIRLPPVGAIVVEHPALRELAVAELSVRPPAWIIADPVRRIGDHHVRLRSRQHWRDIGRAGAVTAANPMVVQQPYVAGPSDRLI